MKGSLLKRSGMLAPVDEVPAARTPLGRLRTIATPQSSALTLDRSAMKKLASVLIGLLLVLLAFRLGQATKPCHTEYVVTATPYGSGLNFVDSVRLDDGQAYFVRSQFGVGERVSLCAAKVDGEKRYTLDGDDVLFVWKGVDPN